MPIETDAERVVDLKTIAKNEDAADALIHDEIARAEGASGATGSTGGAGATGAGHGVAPSYGGQTGATGATGPHDPPFGTRRV